MLDRFKRLRLSEADIDALKEYYDKYKSIPLPSREDFLEFSRTGNRLSYENMYFALRHRINAAFMLWKAAGGKYIGELRAQLYAVCGEPTWALPAHTSDPDAAEIDLFAAETSMMLAEIAYLSEGAIGADLVTRIKAEIRERIFEPFSRNRYRWEESKHNWSAVCAGAVGAAYLYLAPDELPLGRIIDAMKAYISGYNDEGICFEGIGYWSYGFGFYLYFADILLKMRGVDIIHSDKLRRIAEFPRSSTLCGNVRITCSDAPEDFRAPEGLMGMINEYYGISAAAGTERTDECGRWAHFIRSYLYPYSTGAEADKGEFIFERSQWYINRKESYGFFIKGGTNGEPHNHNDIGSFIIADGKGQLLCDLGMGEYTRGYFDEKQRYSYLCCSSLGHSVPIIDGLGQRTGGDFRCDGFVCGGNRASVSFGGSYGGGIKILREARLYENKIRLRDTFSFADGKPHKIIERFVSTVKPVIEDSATVIGGLRMNRTGEIREETISAHDGAAKTVYLTDIPASDTFETEIYIKSR